MTDLPHGYSLADVDLLARQSARADGGAGVDDARGWIVERIYSAGAKPTRGELIHGARWAAGDEIAEYQRSRGMHKHRPMPRFVEYWFRPAAGFEERIVEREALAQILARLNPSQLAAVRALAEHGTYEAAAAALGISDYALTQRIVRARHRFDALWYEGETPPRRRRIHTVHRRRRPKGRRRVISRIERYERIEHRECLGPREVSHAR